MAAVLFRFEEMLADNDGERVSLELDNGYNYSQVSFDDRYKQKRAEVDLWIGIMLLILRMNYLIF